MQKGPQTESISCGLPTNATCQRRVVPKIGSVWSGFLKCATIPQTRNNLLYLNQLIIEKDPKRHIHPKSSKTNFKTNVNGFHKTFFQRIFNYPKLGTIILDLFKVMFNLCRGKSPFFTTIWENIFFPITLRKSMDLGLAL